MKILVAADGSSYTKRMLAYLAAHDEWMGGAHQYTVIHTAQPVSSNAASLLDKAVLHEHYADDSEKVFRPIRTFFKKQGLDATFVGKVGHAADVIATTAVKGKYDLIVMGSAGHSALANMVMGSVTTKVLAQCSTPVLLIR